MSIIVDFHSHILPAVDDGSQSVEESLEMLQLQARQGIERVMATPHFYAQHDNLEQFLIQRRRAEHQLREAMQSFAGLPEIHVGAEVHYFSGISDSDAIAALAFDNGKHILVEMPRSPWSGSMFQELERLYIKQGLIPIIAHVERYIGRFRTYGIPERLSELPVLVQANAEFFLNRKTSSQALRMLKKEQIHLLGSDCHNLTTRKPNLGEAVILIEDCLGKKSIEWIASHQQTVFPSK